MSKSTDREQQSMTDFEAELRALLNKHNREAGSDTPDWILAQYLRGQLELFNLVQQARDKYYGFHQHQPVPPHLCPHHD